MLAGYSRNFIGNYASKQACYSKSFSLVITYLHVCMIFKVFWYFIGYFPCWSVIRIMFLVITSPCYFIIHGISLVMNAILLSTVVFGICLFMLACYLRYLITWLCFFVTKEICLWNNMYCISIMLSMCVQYYKTFVLRNSLFDIIARYLVTVHKYLNLAEVRDSYIRYNAI